MNNGEQPIEGASLRRVCFMAQVEKSGFLFRD
jgi:hypothetical protein